MAPTFYVGSEAGLKKLDEYLLSHSYITGYQASKDDLAVHGAFPKPPSTQYVNVSRWYNHIEALLRISGVSAEGSGVTIEGFASFPDEAIATPPVANTKAAADEDDDSDVDLFGEETEEEKKGAEDRAAALKASGKKKEYRGLSFKNRYWVKASLWIIIFGYVGNYFWTHYFFIVLGASYTFPSWKMNNVPHTTFLLTIVCFLFYHVTSNMTIRRLHHAIAHLPVKTQWVIKSAWILALSYFIAFLETIAISNFPYYSFVNRTLMYKVGSLFYGIYFLVSFPMFLRIDENVEDPWDLPRVAVDALGAAMLVTIILDLWRLFLGPIVPIPDSKMGA